MFLDLNSEAVGIGIAIAIGDLDLPLPPSLRCAAFTFNILQILSDYIFHLHSAVADKYERKKIVG